MAGGDGDGRFVIWLWSKARLEKPPIHCAQLRAAEAVCCRTTGSQCPAELGVPHAHHLRTVSVKKVYLNNQLAVPVQCAFPAMILTLTSSFRLWITGYVRSAVAMPCYRPIGKEADQTR